jgi:GR25 family glycosyltransferase involved in LPS biosynthesis
MSYISSMIVYLKSEIRVKNYEEIKKYFQNLNKFEAIDAINYYEKYKKIALESNFLTKNYISYCDNYHGKLGCNLSHIYLLKSFLEKNEYEWLLVLEDDLELNNFNEKIINLLIKIANKYNSNFIQLYTGPTFIENQKKSKIIKSNIYEMIPQWYTLAYLINKKGIEIILSKLPWDNNVDNIFSNNIKELNALCFTNDIFLNKGSLNSKDKKSDFGSIIWNISSKL